VAKLDMSKRAVLSAGAAGVTGLLLFRLAPEAQGAVYNPGLIRPPGARPEREFLQRCIQCGTCMKACPTNALHPTLFEAGFEGIWTPMLVASVGYCEYNCNFCGQVCPTEAIQPLPLPQKQKTKIGLAVFDTTRCLPYAFVRECMVCEEHCPISTKAIYFIPTEVKTRDGNTLVLKQPKIDPDLCIGCGICENVCVYKDRPAVRITSANEDRNAGNRPILPGLPPPPQSSSPAPSTSSESNPYGQ
jgi:MauM/NapG family ferredoxin protein